VPVSRFVEEHAENLDWPRLRINGDKTVIVSKKHRRYVTGLNLTSDGEVSVGRKKKREMRSLLHKFKKTELDIELIGYLRGWMAYINAVEPNFLGKIKVKYGEDTLAKLFEYRLKNDAND